MPRAQTAPSPVSPRLLRRERAAAYLDISAGSFDKLVRDGVLPAPKKLQAFKVWDRADLDALVETLPYDGGDSSELDALWDD